MAGDVLKVYEAARYENGSPAPRELLKMRQYDAAGIDSHFEEVPSTCSFGTVPLSRSRCCSWRVC